jgi:transposase
MIEDSKKMWEKFDEEFSKMGTSSSSSSSLTMKSETSKSSNVDEKLSSAADKTSSNIERSLFPASFNRLPSIFSRDFDEFPKFRDDQIIKVNFRCDVISSTCHFGQVPFRQPTMANVIKLLTQVVYDFS